MSWAFLHPTHSVVPHTRQACFAGSLSVVLDSHKYPRISNSIRDSHIQSATIREYCGIPTSEPQVTVSFDSSTIRPAHCQNKRILRQLFLNQSIYTVQSIFLLCYKAERSPIFNKFSACFVFNNAIIYVCDRYIIWNTNG